MNGKEGIRACTGKYKTYRQAQKENDKKIDDVSQGIQKFGGTDAYFYFLRGGYGMYNSYGYRQLDKRDTVGLRI